MEALNPGDIQTVGVVGAGTLGAGIAQLFVSSGFEVRLCDVSEDILSRAEERIQRGLARAETPGLFSLLRKATDLRSMRGCDVVIEAAAEDLETKRDILRRLDQMIEPPRLLATSSSLFSVSAVASAAEDPDRVLGIHFLRPAAAMRVVEVVRGEHTVEAAAKAAVGLVERAGKTAVRCKDSPGFVVDRMARPFYRTGLRLVEEGAGAPADIDGALREAGGFQWGPLELLDFIGLDADLALSRAVHEGLGRPERLRPRPLQAALVERGQFGRRTGCGLYLYGESPPGTTNPALEDLVPLGSKPMAPPEVLREVARAIAQEARAAAEEGVALREDIEVAMRLGLAWPEGLVGHA